MITMKSLKIALLVIFPLISSAQWSIIGGMTLNQSKIITDVNSGNSGSYAMPLIITKYKFSPNVSFGLRKEALFNDKIGYNLELLYLGRSLKLSTPNSKAFTHKLLVVPVLFVFNLNNSLALEAGPQADILLMKEIGYSRRLNASGIVGLRYKTKSALGFGIMFNNSLTNTIREQPDRYKLTHSTGTVYLGYKISKK